MCVLTSSFNLQNQSYHTYYPVTHFSFIHFEPDGHSNEHGFNPNDEDHYESLLNIKGGFTHNGGLPPYIVDGSLEAYEWRRSHPEEEWEPRWAYEADEEEGTGSNGAHYAAHAGDVKVLQHIIEILNTGRI